MKIFFTISFFIIQYAVLLILPSQTFAAENPVGKIIGVTGTIEFLPAGSEPVAEAKPGEVQKVSFEKWEQVKFHQAVYAKDIFRTARKSRLKILLSDNSLIALGPNSEVKVESYLFNKEDKLRQGVIGVAYGLSMYIVNKSQTHKKSSFRIVTPTANIGARGTQGYTSASERNTFVANLFSSVETSNINPEIRGMLILRENEGNNIPKDEPPTPAKPLTPETMEQVNIMVMGLKALTPGETSGFAGEFLAASAGNLAEFFEENIPFPDSFDNDQCIN